MGFSRLYLGYSSKESREYPVAKPKIINTINHRKEQTAASGLKPKEKTTRLLPNYSLKFQGLVKGI